MQKVNENQIKRQMNEGRRMAVEVRWKAPVRPGGYFNFKVFRRNGKGEHKTKKQTFNMHTYEIVINGKQDVCMHSHV